MRGAGQSPIYAFLGRSGKLPAWNFSKYVVDKQGKVVAFFESQVTPEDPALRAAIAKAMAGNSRASGSGSRLQPSPVMLSGHMRKLSFLIATLVLCLDAARRSLRTPASDGSARGRRHSWRVPLPPARHPRRRRPPAAPVASGQPGPAAGPACRSAGWPCRRTLRRAAAGHGQQPDAAADRAHERGRQPRACRVEQRLRHVAHRRWCGRHRAAIGRRVGRRGLGEARHLRRIARGNHPGRARCSSAIQSTWRWRRSRIWSWTCTCRASSARARLLSRRTTAPRRPTYLSEAGDHTGAAVLPSPTRTGAWFLLARIEVMAPANAAAVVAFGDSITDGARSTVDTNNRWPDHLARRLAASGRPVGVLNAGISGNRVLSDGAGRERPGPVRQGRADADRRHPRRGDGRDQRHRPGSRQPLAERGGPHRGSQAAHRARARPRPEDLRRHADAVRRGGVLQRPRARRSARR